jgi:hypothetical protein
MKRLPRHASLEPSSDRTWAPPLLWAHVPSLGGLISLCRKSALGMPTVSLVVPGVVGAEGSQLGQQATLPCGCRGVASLKVCQRRKALSLWRRGNGASFKRTPYHRPQARRLQRDVQLTGPLAVGEVHCKWFRWWWRLGRRWQQPPAGEIVNLLELSTAPTGVLVHDDESWHG